MKIKIFWEKENTTELLNKVKSSLDELWLVDFIQLEETNDNSLKEELNITKQPALIIEEESIDFKDTIFEWIVPSEDEIKSMLISIIGWWDTGGWCGKKDESGWCGSGCSC